MATTLRDYIADPERASALAEAVGSHRQWLYQIAVGWRGKRASRMLALAIERATNGAVSCHSLRPDIFDPPASRVANEPRPAAPARKVA